MNTNDNSSITETTDLFYSESSKLEYIVSQSLKNSDVLSLSEIIEVYYQVINVTSLVKFLRQNLEDIKNAEENKLVVIRMQEIEKRVSEIFDANLHPLIMSNLKNSIENSIKKLKDLTTNQPEKTKENLGNHAKMYEELRQIMSTKEFVDQYNDGLDNP
jgi:hypothetical protein